MALFQLPKCSRWAICLIVNVVSRRNRAASSSFSGALRFLSSKSARAHPRRCNASAMNQMEVIAHETVGMQSEIRLLTGLGQRLEEILAIHLIVEDVLPAIATTHDVVDGPGIFNAHLARHGSSVPTFGQSVMSLL